jgi:predicted unusual protein kinase regulating ubiquinone biosynthesis (AarF/ABC1/UbiB family)
MDFLDGIKVTDVEELRAAGMDTAQVAHSLIDIYNVMVLRHGMFHADPHPGNLLVLPPIEAGGPARIGLIDFGLTKRLPEEFRQQVIVLTSAIVAQHRQQVSEAMEEMGFRTRVPDEETYYALGEAFLGDVLRSGKAYADQALFAEVNVRLGRILRANPLVEVPGDVILIARVMGLLSGIGRTLDSQTDLIESLIPYLEEQTASEAAS